MAAEERLLHFLHNLGLHRGGPGKQTRITPADHAGAHQLYQVSTLNAIMEGVYDGRLSYGELRRHGDFGLGTFNALDGEMVAVDGEFYQIKESGDVVVVEDAMRTPFAVVQFFQPEARWMPDQPLTFAGLPDLLAGHMPSENYFYAVRIDGRFAHVKARSVPRQSKPYPPLAEVTKHQAVFEFSEIEGSIAGFRFPDYAQGINMPGFHLHFISADRQQGGHVLDFTLTAGACAVEHTADFYMELPETSAFGAADLAKDQTAATQQAER
jgi:acetolactate decarboxylase